jgi:hypothetical protein
VLTHDASLPQWGLIWMAAVAAAAAAGCSCGTGPDASDASGVDVSVQPDAARIDGGDTGPEVIDASLPDADLDAQMDAGPCHPAEVLIDGVCVTPEACDAAGECAGDRCCADGACLPFGVGPCPLARVSCDAVFVGAGVPVEACRWTRPADPILAGRTSVATTPLVADFDFDGDPTTIRPSIVFIAFEAIPPDIVGSLFIIDGADCVEEYRIDETYDVDTVFTTPALGDLDGDGRPEIVTVTAAGVLVALRYDRSSRRFSREWMISVPVGGQAPRIAPSIHDLDGDGWPEVVLGTRVVDGRTGALRLDPLTSLATPILAADVDGDRVVELVGAQGTWEPDWASGAWVLDAAWTGPGVPPTLAPPALALADFGDFGEGPGVAELVVVSTRGIEIRGADGRSVWGPIAAPPIPLGAGPGAPLIADFDGDGEPEVGVAAADQYLLYDRECDVVPLPAYCDAAGVRWTRPFDDSSSGAVGAAGFDFDGDGAVEIVHADQCYVRIADGANGRLLASAARRSATWLEYPTVVDVDGDGSAEIIAALSSWGCPAVDPQFEGPACSVDRPCPTSLYECVAGTCRASRPADSENGIVVYEERDSRWVGTRPIWNQYDYRVTHVRADATIPAAGDWIPNFATAGRNDFRVNAAGAASAVDAVDFTVRAQRGWTCDGSTAQRFEVDVCNRGVLRADPGAHVTFSSDGDVICGDEYTTVALESGDCARVVCEWDAAPGSAVPIDVRVDAGHQLQCATANDSITLRCD